MDIIQIGEDNGIRDWLKGLGHDVSIVSGLGADLKKPAHPDLVVFTGGSDVSPFLYNAENTDSLCNPQRDLTEVAYYHKFFNVNKLGICRGGQFLHVMNGGRMIQDIPNHGLSGTHKAYHWTSRDIEYDVTSTHHQMMDYGITDSMAYAQLNGNDRTEPESFYYQKSKSLCFQPHPEYEKKNENGLYAQYGTNKLLKIISRETEMPLYAKNLGFEGDLVPPAAKGKPAAAAKKAQPFREQFDEPFIRAMGLDAGVMGRAREIVDEKPNNGDF